MISALNKISTVCYDVMLHTTHTHTHTHTYFMVINVTYNFGACHDENWFKYLSFDMSFTQSVI